MNAPVRQPCDEGIIRATPATSVCARKAEPWVLAATIMFPAVVALAMATGVTSGWITAVNLLDLSTTEFVQGLRLFYVFKDIWFGLVKSMSFGFAIALIGCHRGFHCDAGAEGVGRAATSAFVASFVVILVLDLFLGIALDGVYYAIWPEAPKLI